MSDDVRPTPTPEEYDGATEHPDSIDLGREWAWFVVHGQEANQLFAGETPRGAAVLARAYVEAMIVDYLRLLAQRRPDLAKKIKDILGSGLGKKIDALESYSEVYPEAVRDMRALKAIGDRFAHRPRTRTFDSDDVIDLLRDLERATRESTEDPEDASPPHPPESDERHAVARRGQTILAFALHLCMAAMSPLLVGDDSAAENA